MGKPCYIVGRYEKVIIIGRLWCNPIRINREYPLRDYVRFVVHRTNGDLSVDSFRVVCFGKLVDVCEKYLHKGQLCCVEGVVDSIRSRPVFSKRITFLNDNETKLIPDGYYTTNNDNDLVISRQQTDCR